MSNNREDQQERFTKLMRGLGTRTVLYQQKVAASLELYNNDFLSIDILHEKGPVTAGELSKLTGLSTGSVTALIDRLEKNGFVRRENDPHDRRKVIIVPLYEDMDEISTIYLSLHAKMIALAASFTEEELEFISRFLEKASLILEEQIHRHHSNGHNPSTS